MKKQLLLLILLCSFNLTAKAQSLISNNYFSSTSAWQFTVSDGADAEFSIQTVVDGSSTIKYGRVSVHSETANSYDVQLYQSGFTVEEGKSYRLIFKAWTDTPTETASIGVQLVDHTNTGVGSSVTTVTVDSDSSKDHMVVFNALDSTIPNARLRFRLGGVEKNVNFDNTFLFAPESVILKLDDLVDNAEQIDMFKNVETLIDNQQVKAGFGIVANHFIDDGSATKQDFYDTIISFDLNPAIEIWNHGWNHTKWREYYPSDQNSVQAELKEYVYEFSGRKEYLQYLHLWSAQQIVKEKTGITMTAFGAPYNQTDSATVDALNKIPELTVFLFPKTLEGERLDNDGSPLVYAGNSVNYSSRVDFETSNEASFSDFENNYNEPSRRKTETLVLQGHPGYWDQTDIDQLDEIISLLKANGHEFILPSELQ